MTKEEKIACAQNSTSDVLLNWYRWSFFNAKSISLSQFPLVTGAELSDLCENLEVTHAELKRRLEEWEREKSN